MKKYTFPLTRTYLFLILLLILTQGCKNRKYGYETTSEEKDQYTYVGRESCKECHPLQYELYQGSDHDMAMDHATEESALGDFNESTFTHFGITSKFYKIDSAFFVYTEGPGGVMQEYRISFTFGIRPLQQYLIQFPGGAYQCLPIAWDTRPAEKGGQRWFHLYGDEQITHDDILFWTKPVQNWNYMCSECHSTNLKKAYDMEPRTYNTTWSEIDVSCESCHGPSSKHVEWAERVEEGASPDVYEDMGLVLRLKDTDNATWIFHPDSSTARRSVPRESDELVQMCARCHSRRSVTTEDYYHGGSLLETHWPSLLDEDLYFADGQIQDEVYVYGSFLQSKMYMSGVVCKDCHEPHSGKVYVNGNALCYRCHRADVYGGREHHFHDPAKEGASCMECHMHERTYMVLDPRRDHSIRIPRPDLSDKLGTPNACTQCHQDKTNSWAARYMEKWYGKDLLEKKHYGETFWEGREGYPGAIPELKDLASNTSNAPMVRATALSLLSNYSDPSIDETLAATIQDKKPLVRYATLYATQILGTEKGAQLALESLKDSVRLVRIVAANTLVRYPQEIITEEYRPLFQKALDEYMESLKINADHPGTHVNYGNLYLYLGDFDKAEQSYREAIRIEPELVTAYINLADLYRRTNRDQLGREVLEDALQRYPDLAQVNYAIGLFNVRQGDQEGAMQFLKRAASLAPEEAHYSYVYGIALNSNNRPDEARAYLVSALERHPYDRDILYALTTMNIESGNKDEAVKYAKRLADAYPEGQNYQQLLEMIK